MPNQARPLASNLIELLKETVSYPSETFAPLFRSKAPNGVIYAETVNDRFPYTANRKKRLVNPLEFAIDNKLFHRIQFLFENHATHDIPGFDAFKSLVAMNAPLPLLRYCMENNKCHDNEKYPALFAAYAQPDAPLEKFEAIHEYCFGLTFEAILLEKKPLYMAQAEFDNKIKLYAQELSRCALLKDNLKSIYSDIIKHNADYRSHLKISLIFGKESPVVNFLRTNHDSMMQNTKEYQQLQVMLKKHTLSRDNITHIRLELDRCATPNQALAGLYFANADFSKKEDYQLFMKHLVAPRKTFNQDAQRHFERLLKNYLNNDEMAKLKQNCLKAIENSRHIRLDFAKELNNEHAKSPMGTITRTGTRSRNTFETGTLKECIKLCLFGNPAKPAARAEPPVEAPVYLYDAPPAYNPAFNRP